jgi:L-amino acid N-acyltransferase YncA
MTIKIRNSEARDIPCISSLYNEYVQTSLVTFETELVSEEEMDSRRKALIRKGYPYLVAESANEQSELQSLVGFAYASSYRTREAYQNTVECSVYVNSHYHRQGIGSALLRELVDQCQKLRYMQMVAVIGGSDNQASIQLHKKHNFRVVGTLESVGFKHGQWVDTVILQRALVPGNMT